MSGVNLCSAEIWSSNFSSRGVLKARNLDKTPFVIYIYCSSTFIYLFPINVFDFLGHFSHLGGKGPGPLPAPIFMLIFLILLVEFEYVHYVVKGRLILSTNF